MGKIKGAGLTGWSGKYTDEIVLKVFRDGTNVFAHLPEKAKVPTRSGDQLKYRSWMGVVVNDYPAFRGHLNYSFEEEHIDQTMRRLFLKYNLKEQGCYMTKSMRKAGAQVLGNFIVSDGPADTLPPIDVVEADGKFVTNIGLGDLTLNADTTQAQLAEAIAANNGEDFYLSMGADMVSDTVDSIVIMYARQLVDLRGEKPTISVSTQQIELRSRGAARERKLSELFDLSKLSVTDVVNGTETRHCLTLAKGSGIVMATVIHSRRKGKGRTLCSCQQLVGSNPVRDALLSDKARDEAYLSYGGVNWYDTYNPDNQPPADNNRRSKPDISGLRGDDSDSADSGSTSGTQPGGGSGTGTGSDPTPGGGNNTPTNPPAGGGGDGEDGFSR